MGTWRRLALVVVVAASAVGVGGCSVLGGGGGKITIEPNYFNCLDMTQVHTVTITLPSSVHSGDSLSIGTKPVSGSLENGQVWDTRSVEGWGFAAQGDGTWYLSVATNSQAAAQMLTWSYECGFAFSGQHTMVVTDAAGNILAQGTYTQS